MKRSQIEHLIRAASAITRHRDMVIIGSQSILGSHPDAPDELLASVEADMYPLANPADSILIDGVIGERSAFHDTFGYYAHGVGPETATLPAGWESRLVIIDTVDTGGGRGLCLDPHDLAVSKLVAARDRDLDFVRTLLRRGMVRRDVLEARSRLLGGNPADEALLLGRVQRLLK